MGASFNGRTQVSKTCNVGSIPTAPAKGVRVGSATVSTPSLASDRVQNLYSRFES